MRQIFVQGPGSLGRCAGGFVEKKVDLWQWRQALLDTEFAHVADQRAPTQHRDGDASESGCLQPSDAVADACDPPSQASGFQAFDCMVTIDIAGGQ